jgi:hypothetical protein
MMNTATIADSGNYANAAAVFAGISESTYYAWLERGRSVLESSPVPAAERPYLEFLQAVTRASAEAEVEAVALIRKAARDGDYLAALRFLERRYPERWGNRRRVEHTVPGREPVEVRLSFGHPRLKLSKLSDAELETFKSC